MYSKVNKPKGFEKSVTSHFSEVGVLVKQLRAEVTPNRDIWDSITVVVATDALHEEFEHVTSGLLRQGRKKSISEIHSILSSAKAKLLSKRAVGATTKLAHMLRNNNQKRKATATSDDECFNYHKMRHFGRDCRMPNYRLLKKKSTDNARQDRDDSLRPRNYQQQRANVAAVNTKEYDSDPEPFRPGKALMTAESNIMSRTKSM